MAHRVVLLEGDGIGPEIGAVVRAAVEATGVAIEWIPCPVGEAAIAKHGVPLPDAVVEKIREVGVALKGPVTTPIGKGFRSVNVALRQALDLYACVRPCRTIPGVKSRYREVDLVIVRENTEDLYAGIEFQRGSQEAADLARFVKERQPNAPIDADCGISIKPISLVRSRRIVEFAFDYAKQHGRRKVTAVHKANIMKHSDGVFLEAARQVAKERPEIAFSERIVDALCMDLVTRPWDYDVLVLPNLYGDIVSDLCAGLVGGLGVAPGANVGLRGAVFEATHGSAPDIAGQNKANPTALLLSAALMLEHLGEPAAARRLEAAVAAVIAEGHFVTPDLKDALWDGAIGTREMGQAIVARIVADPHAGQDRSAP
jgi:isocitrate dehydrogenase (NAD+)